MSKLYDFTCQKKHETEKAYLVTTDGEDKVWLPKEQTELELNKDQKTYTATIPMWLAAEKKLV